jgi:hypothetical protein
MRAWRSPGYCVSVSNGASIGRRASRRPAVPSVRGCSEPRD